MNIFLSSTAVLCKLFCFIFNIFLLSVFVLIYSSTAKQSDELLPTFCHINQTIVQQIPCPSNEESNMKKLCPMNLYGIHYGKDFYAYFDQLPSWISPIDRKSLSQKRWNFTCYVNRENPKHIQWIKRDSKSIVKLILLYFFTVFFIFIRHMDETRP